MKYLISGLVFLISLNLFAFEQNLALVSSDEDSDTYNIIAKIDDNTNQLLSLFKDNYVKGVKTKRTQFNLANLNSTEGLVLESRGEYKVIALQSFNFDKFSGGIITIDTLYNGATGERHKYEIQIAKDKSGWRIFSSKKAVTKLQIQVNKKLVLGIVGVKNIRME